MTDIPTTFDIIDADNNTLHVNATQTADDTITPHSTPEVGGAVVDNGNPLVVAQDAASYVNRSGSIVTGGVAQELMAANPARRGWWLRNTSAENLYVNETGVAAVQGTPSWTVPPSTDFPNVTQAAAPSAAISIIGPSNGQTFIAREY